MDTQNTPIHIKLWHREFWMLALADLLLSMTVYMQIPLIREMTADAGLSQTQTACVYGAYGAGLFLLGGFCSYLVERFRRAMICRQAVILTLLTLVGCYYISALPAEIGRFPFLIALRILFGAFYGLSQMILTSTLIIDTCESFQRTEANHGAAWFSRFALSLGPVLALALMQIGWRREIYLVAAALALAAWFLIRSVKFPFKTPLEQMPRWTLDRFLLPEGWLLSLNLMLITAVIGLILTQAETLLFYAMMMAGFFLALLAEKFVFADADLKSETITGLILIGAALLMMALRTQPAVKYISPAFIGFGIGIIGSRFLLFFIKLSHHCQRGTSQSTFFLSWEWGITLGLFLGLTVPLNPLNLAFIFVVVNLVLYNFVTHPWYMKNKNR